MPTPREALTAALLDCDRFVSGHGPPRPRHQLEALLAELAADERADAYGEGALVADFEAEVARLLGKPAAVLMPSGTMAQQIAARVWSDRRGVRTVAWHPTCHLQLHEHDAYAALHGLRAHLVGNPRLPLARADLDAVHERVAMLLLELPQREIGGALPTWEELGALVAWARERGVALHLDGARLWECGPFYARPYAEIAALFDSAYVSLYKILGATSGAVLAGDAEFVAEARVWRARHGGRLVQLWPMALGGRRGLRERLPRVAGYCERARSIARTLAQIEGVAVTPHPPRTNMMHVYLRAEADAVLTAAAAIARAERVALFRGLRTADVPGWCAFELSVGDATAAIPDDELARLVRRLLA